MLGHFHQVNFDFAGVSAEDPSDYQVPKLTLRLQLAFPFGEPRGWQPAEAGAASPTITSGNTPTYAVRNRSFKRLNRAAVLLFRTAIAMAFFEPMRMTSCLPRVMAV